MEGSARHRAAGCRPLADAVPVMDSGLDAFPRTRAGPRTAMTPQALSRSVVVTLRSCAAENPDAFRRQIRFQRLPGHEGDILALGIGADRVGGIMEGQAGAFA